MRICAGRSGDAMESKAMAILQVRNLAITFGERQIVRNLSFRMADGEKVGLVGDNGVGKTSIMRVIHGDLQPDRGDVVLKKRRKDGVCYIPQHLSLRGARRGTDVLSFMLDGRGLREISSRLAEIDALVKGPVGQARLGELMDERVRLEEQYLEKEGYRAEADILDILLGVGLDRVELDQQVATLSGGQKSRLALARLLFQRLDLLLLDEPTNHIDEEAVDWLGGYLSSVPQSVLVISHVPTFLDRVVTRILLLDSTGELKSYPGNYSKFVHLRSRQALAQRRVTAKLQTELARQRGIIRTAERQSNYKLKHARERVIARLEKQLPRESKTRHVKISFSAKTPLHAPALTARSISKSFGEKRVLDRVSVEIGAAERLGIVGDNGAGKTTLLRILAGELEPDTGTLRRSRKLELGWYRQELEDLEDDNFIWQEVQSLGFGTQPQLRSALAHFLFGSKRLHQRVGTLSRGERARLALCKLILARPNLLLLDEPTNHLDQPSRARLAAALAQYQGALIVVAHDAEFLAAADIEWGLHLPRGRSVRIEELPSVIG
ncbi:MAG: ABC-F family ATP-binding cassette domain-containing protein [Armatimonadetes bacterium]|nr:ABC-F family ATP-binding cassette domain-containing protein [Armatimonadota bacterium]